MRDQIDLPLTREYPMPFKATVYPSREGGRGVVVRGQGTIKMTFEETRESDAANIRIEDLWLHLFPASIPYDIDGDGLLEHVDLAGIELGAEDFDLEKSGGEYNLENGYITLNLVFNLRLDVLMPGLEREGIEEPVHFEISERGWFDALTGRGLTHSEMFTIRDGPFAGATIEGCQFGCDDECFASLNLGLWLLTPHSPSAPAHAKDALKLVHKHQSTPVLVLWNSTNSGKWQVDVQPGINLVAPNARQVIPDPSSPNPDLQRPIDRDLKLTADTKGGICSPAHDQASIDVCRQGDFVASSAAWYDDGHNRWSARLNPQEWDQNLKINQVIIDTGKPDSVAHPNWSLVHQFPTDPPTNTQITALNTWTPVSFVHSMPGNYFFRANSPGFADTTKRVYFRLKIA